MKTLAIITFLLFHINAYGQNADVLLDTVYVNEKRKVTLAMPDIVSVAIVGSNYCYAEAGQEMVTIGAVEGSENMTPAGLTVKSGDLLYFAIVAYKAQLQFHDLFKDFRNTRPIAVTKVKDAVIETTKEETHVKVYEPVIKQDSSIINRLKAMEWEEREHYNLYGQKLDKIIFKLNDMMQDSTHLYVKLQFRNKSNRDYEIEIVDFVYETSETNQPDYAEILEENGITRINSGDKQELVYAINKINLGKKAKLTITIREKRGKRKMSFNIPSIEIIKAKQF